MGAAKRGQVEPGTVAGPAPTWEADREGALTPDAVLTPTTATESMMLTRSVQRARARVADRAPGRDDPEPTNPTLPPAPGTDALLRRLERRDPPAAVVIVGAGVALPADRDPRGVADVSVLELPAGVDPELVGWDAVRGLETVIVVDGLDCDPERLSAALRAAGARRGTVATLTGRGPVRRPA